MKKSIVLVVLFTLLFSSGCSSNDDTAKSNEDDNTVNTSSQQEITSDEAKADDTVDTSSLSQLQYDYIINTFEEYGYTPPSSDNWIIKHEGDKKIAIIIKEKNGNQYNVNKLVFLWENDEAQLLLVKINNQIIHGNE